MSLYNFIPTKKYLFVGALNTFFGYTIGIINYYLFYEMIGVILLSILNNFIAITFSFTMYKLIVFKTDINKYLYEYFKSYIVYSLAIFISIFVLWFTLEILLLNIFVAQGLTIAITVIFSYIGHKRFTFKS